MDRRKFCGMAGAGATGVALPVVVGGEAEARQQRQYEWAIEIVDAPEGGCGRGHQVGDRFDYPNELGHVCVWLQDSMSGFLRVLESNGTLRWLYTGTKYQKEIDPDGVTTEFVRCPDPTTKVVAKIIRTRVG